MLAALLASCGAGRPPVVEQATPVPTPAVLPAAELLRAPQQWSGQEVIVIASLILRDDVRLIAPPGEPEADPERSIWLAEPPPPDLLDALEAADGLARLAGRLSPPGAYGYQQRYPYQFSATRIEALKPERTTIANLALNPQALDGMALRVEGTLLAQPGGALLVDQVSERGVPTAGAYQIKLDPAHIDDSVLANLQQSGEVRWGAVEVVGWWQDRALTPFRIVARSSS